MTSTPTAAPHLAILRAMMMIAVAVASTPGHAQLALPGAVAPAPDGDAPGPAVSDPDAPGIAAPRPKRKTPSEPRRPVLQIVLPTALAGKTLALNAGPSQASFAPAATGGGIEVSRLTLAGTLIGNSRERCQVEVASTPIPLRDVARSNGVARAQLDFPACPISFDVLDGAVLVDRTQAACEFKASNCHVEVAGLWGPLSGDLGPDKAKEIDWTRGQAEQSVRATYKDLVKSTKDRVAIASYARDQAQFSSTREEICRDYVGEGRHGYCAAKLTEARAAFLKAQLDTSLQSKAERLKQRAGRHGARPS